MRELSPTDAAYIAGFFDGEGGIFVANAKAHGRHLHQLTISITNINAEILWYIVDTTGLGNVTVHMAARGNNRQSWIWRLQANKAQEFLRLILPYLRVKRRLAEIALTFPGGTPGRLLTPSECDARQLVYDLMKAINSGQDDQSVTTIPSGSTREANARGSARRVDPDAEEI